MTEPVKVIRMPVTLLSSQIKSSEDGRMQEAAMSKMVAEVGGRNSGRTMKAETLIKPIVPVPVPFCRENGGSGSFGDDM